MKINTNCKTRYKVNVSANPFEMLFVIWYHLHNLKNVRDTHGGFLLLVKASLHKWYQIAQCITYKANNDRGVIANITKNKIKTTGKCYMQMVAT